MELDEPTLKGWRSFKGTFLFGAAEQRIPPPELSERHDGVCSHESMGNGVYVASCDFDRLYQQ